MVCFLPTLTLGISTSDSKNTFNFLVSSFKCLAYRNNEKTVTEAVFKEFLELADFMNFDFNPL